MPKKSINIWSFGLSTTTSHWYFYEKFFTELKRGLNEKKDQKLVDQTINPLSNQPVNQTSNQLVSTNRIHQSNLIKSWLIHDFLNCFGFDSMLIFKDSWNILNLLLYFQFQSSLQNYSWDIAYGFCSEKSWGATPPLTSPCCK